MSDWNKELEKKIEDFAATQPNNIIVNEMLSELRKVEGLTGKTIPSLRAKTNQLGYYQKIEKKATVGGTPTKRKMEFVNGIEILANMPKGSLDSLEKGSKVQLEALAKAFQSLSDSYNAELDATEPDSE